VVSTGAKSVARDLLSPFDRTGAHDSPVLQREISSSSERRIVAVYCSWGADAPTREAGVGTRELRAAGLDDAAVAELRRRLAAAVVRVCPPWIADAADDIVQAAILQLLKRVERSGGMGELTSMYLTKMAHGLVVDEVRRRSRRREEALDSGEGPSPAADEVTGPDHQAAAREIGRGIVECIGRLARPRALVVTLWLRGASAPETARRLGWTAKKVEHLLGRGRTELRECLEGKGLRP
jgi:RNA polymerase sigma factor (sigma-70 family)